ncbi:MAG: hypothetical protein H7062_16070 [Candidatus Saccharimonas sp.]|nr:hypothetical protein [Planctomycetaceae bacterium]
MSFTRLLPMVLLAFALSGCADPVTLQNYNRIETGMTLKQVEEIFGKPGESYQGLKTWRGGHSRHTITVEFDDRGLVVTKTQDGL